MPGQPPYIAVVGPGEASAEEERTAERVGELLAARGAVLVCGGLGGVMAAACRGAAQAGGTTLGLLPGGERDAANPWVKLALPTRLGELRNGVIVSVSDALIAIGGAYGTLSEIALALRAGKPVVGLRTWAIEGIDAVDSPEAAVARALAAGA